jgi:hypothetical protein
MAQRTCEVEGCTKPHRARGLCATHYNQLDPNRHRKMTVPCTWCMRPCVKESSRAKRYGRLFCSLACRDNWRAMLAGTNACLVPITHPAHPDRIPPLPVLWVAPAPKPSTRRWVAGSCHLCGSAYVAEDYTNTARYCSTRCAKRADKDRYRARKRGAYVADVWRERIFQRDGWRCQLCRKKVRRDKVVPHPLAPVLDHIVPLARGGTHEPANTQCAHYLCNSFKRDTLGQGVQLLLFG